MLCTEIVYDIQNNFCTQHVLPCSAKRRASDKDLPLPRPQLKLPYASCCCFSVQLHGKQFALLFLPNLISQRGRLCVTTYYVLHIGGKNLVNWLQDLETKYIARFFVRSYV